MRLALAAAACVFVLGIAAALIAPVSRLARLGPIDVADAYDVAIFHCAGQIVGHSDPYAAEPLGSCERAALPAFRDDSIAPAPQPGYLLAAFAPFARMPEPRFSFATIVSLIAALVLASGFLAQISGFRAWAIFAGMLLGPGYENLAHGQLGIFVVPAIAGAAYALQLGRPRLAAVALFGAMIEPHVGLPAYLALFTLVPRARLTIVLVGACALAASIAATGPAITWEYFSRVLPLQALAEARNVDQYSLTIWAALLGASDTLAVRIGELQYAIFALGSIVVAKRLRDRFDEPAFIVAVPAATAVIGGPFIHYLEAVAVWPLAVLLARYATGSLRVLAAVVIALLVVPWQTAISYRFDLVVCAVVIAVTWEVLGGEERTRRAVQLAAITIPVLVYDLILHRLHPRPVAELKNTSAAFVAATGWGQGLASIPWGVHIRTAHNVVTSTSVLEKVAVFTMFALLVGLACALAAQSRLAPLESGRAR